MSKRHAQEAIAQPLPVGKITQLAAPLPTHHISGHLRMFVSKDLYADHSGRVHLPKWKWTLASPNGVPRALSPGYFESEQEAVHDALRFLNCFPRASRPPSVEVLP